MGRLQRTAAKRSEVCDVRPRTREIILNKPFSPGPNEPKYFEDYPEGGIFELGSVVVDETECVEFAKRYDPQCFHVDPAAAKKSIYGGLITSGWHTGGMMMRLIADNFLSDESSLGSSGIEKLNWPSPVRPGDTLSVRITILKARVSRSKPERGILVTRAESHNQHGALVMSYQAVNFMRRRPDSVNS